MIKMKTSMKQVIMNRALKGCVMCVCIYMYTCVFNACPRACVNMYMSMCFSVYVSMCVFVYMCVHVCAHV